MGKRRLFQRDLGEHPPPLQELFEEMDRTDYRSGRIRWALLPKYTSEEVRANARWFGTFLLMLSGVLLIMAWQWYERFADGGLVAMGVFSLATSLLGIHLLRAGRSATRPPRR